jgi:hypothetical protein
MITRGYSYYTFETVNIEDGRLKRKGGQKNPLSQNLWELGIMLTDSLTTRMMG